MADAEAKAAAEARAAEAAKKSSEMKAAELKKAVTQLRSGLESGEKMTTATRT